jgi:xanthine dehydrogenase accessory factor
MAWSDLRSILNKYERETGPFVLATLVSVSGSSYRGPGARVLISGDGSFVGRVSAGCLEEELVALASSVFATGNKQLMTFDLRPRFACDGDVQILLEPVTKPHPFFAALSDVLHIRTPVFVETIFAGGGEELGTRLTEHPFSVREGTFVQRINPPVRLFIVGRQFDVEPVAQFSRLLGWEIEVVPDGYGLLPADAQTGAVIMSHNFGHDFGALQFAWQREYPYVALVGGHRRKSQLFHLLAEQGVPSEWLERIFSPAGLDIGAESSEEIALAIVSEVQAVLTGRGSGFLRNRSGSIHQWKEAQRWLA